MKSTSFELLGFCAVLLLSGCAGMPDMKNSPFNASSIAGMIPGGSAAKGLIEPGLAAAQGYQEATRDIPEAEEIGFGEKIMSGVLGAAPLYANDRIQRYVNQVGRWVAMHSERPNLPWRFAVLDSPLANAGAAPGGQIYITTGLLFRMRNESELAGALAHEIAHVVQKHHLRVYQKKFMGDVFQSLGTAVLSSQVKVGGGALGDAAKQYVIKVGMGEIRTMILLPLDRAEEEQADRMGMVLTARAGYDPYGLPNVLQLLQELQKDEGGASLLYATHPTPADRIASLDALMGKEMEKYGGQATLQDRYIAMMLGTASSPAAPAKAPAASKTPPKAPATPKKP